MRSWWLVVVKPSGPKVTGRPATWLRPRRLPLAASAQTGVLRHERRLAAREGSLVGTKLGMPVRQKRCELTRQPDASGRGRCRLRGWPRGTDCVSTRRQGMPAVGLGAGAIPGGRAQCGGDPRWSGSVRGRSPAVGLEAGGLAAVGLSLAVQGAGGVIGRGRRSPDVRGAGRRPGCAAHRWDDVIDARSPHRRGAERDLSDALRKGCGVTRDTHGRGPGGIGPRRVKSQARADDAPVRGLAGTDKREAK
jgi:hypothetical protein